MDSTSGVRGLHPYIKTTVAKGKQLPKQMFAPHGHIERHYWSILHELEHLLSYTQKIS